MNYTLLLINFTSLILAMQSQINPLFNASFFGNLEEVKKILETNINPNLQDDSGTTALHCAVKPIAGSPTTKIAIINLLLQKGANPLIKNYQGKTPYEITNNKEIKQILSKAICYNQIHYNKIA